METHEAIRSLLRVCADHRGDDIVLIGIGNTLRRDDGFGTMLAEALRGKVSCLVYAAGVSPENFLGKIAQKNPHIVFFVDAVDFGAEAGTLRLFNAEECKTSNFFVTHNASLAMLFDFIKAQSRARTMCLAVQPARIDFGEGLSPEVRASFKALQGAFLENFPLPQEAK
jgi:hydrogenase maturation protease